MKKSILTVFIFSLLTSPVSAQGFIPSTGSNFVDTSLKTVAASAATCLATKTVSRLVKSATDKTGDFAKKVAAKAVNGVLSTYTAGLLKIGEGEQKVNDEETRKFLENLETKENCWDGIATGLAKTALRQVTNQTIAWVNTGLDGNPTYVRDINSFLYSIKNKQLLNILPEIQNNESIFGTTVRGVLTQQLTGKNTTVNSLIKQTPQAVKYSDFMNDFTQEGWDGLLNTNYNPLSSFFSSINNISGRLANVEQNTRDEINRNNGFLDIKECVEQTTPAPDSKEAPECLRYATTHPGSLISSQIARIYESPIAQMEQVDEINEVIYMFFYNLLDKTFKKNAQGKSGLFYSEFSSDDMALGGTHLGSNIIFDANGKAMSPSSSDLNLTKGFTNIDISRPQELREAIETQIDFIAATEDILVIAADIQPELGELDYCMPGPNPEWATYVGDGDILSNFTSMTEQNEQWWFINKTEKFLLNLVPSTSGNNTVNQDMTGDFSTENLISRSEAWANTNTARTTAFLGGFTVVDKTNRDSYQIRLDTITKELLAPRVTIKIPDQRKVGDAYTTSYEQLVPSPVAIGQYRKFSVAGQRTPSARAYGRADALIQGNHAFIPFYFEHFHTNETSFAQWMKDIINELGSELFATYNKDAIVEAFGATGSTPLQQTLNRGIATSAYRETAGLMSYIDSYNDIIPEYEEIIIQTEDLLRELEVIHHEAQEIVRVAKARYIKERADIGDPVDMACINGAYTINTGPFAKADRYERLLINTNPKITRMNNARLVFEDAALIKSVVEKSNREITRNTSVDNSRFNDRSTETDNGESTREVAPNRTR